ncbi:MULTISPECIES: sulfite exporter TauE/SafE family protein [unclassified Campylobacter]|uniref:sulfite exporter TauE/SafE family protein n=1 Tax=unclassified Campylobacter TaxID=2593542 RepID=UPI001237CD2F|nr:MULTISPECIES: sulfite exporter TauE/SafE family protein [unclassified Campylobacter]KAA6228458.1 sulfite exporter TauE/SafE family protein [Campylobacter sp. LR185c]KAA6228945.1 sulfite exporter TauE/SafE family protein [Campylobacter sp. LR196d]KAA6229430.1 sulfite exporter TauE/SafE family protein [Campylobacter sp. LR286c]KAA6229896.1 sulfite exporter TauE/SafE family protein [Campylobacter sp. LR264d]KAA6234109.1 sulfite exporter TauE/SafE family protein [Campylobacter sp. LR291e]
MSIMDIPYFLIGIISGIASGLFGIGGGMIIVPFMLLLGESSQHAVGISVVQMIFASIFGSYVNYKKKNLNLKDGLIVGLGGLVGAAFSGQLLRLLSDVSLTSIFLGVSCAFFLKYAFGIKEHPQQTNISVLAKNIVLLCTGAFTGIFAISFGIGGGLLITPILAYFLGYNSKKVVPVSLFFVIPASFAGTFSFVKSGVIDYSVINSGIIVGIASMIGVFLGIKIIENMKISSHRKILLCIYVLSISMTTFSLLRKLGIIII